MQVLYYNLDRRKLLQPTVKTYAARQLAVRVHPPVPLGTHLPDMPPLTGAMTPTSTGS